MKQQHYDLIFKAHYELCFVLKAFFHIIRENILSGKAREKFRKISSITSTAGRAIRIFCNIDVKSEEGVGGGHRSFGQFYP